MESLPSIFFLGFSNSLVANPGYFQKSFIKAREQILEETGRLEEYFEVLKKKEAEYPEELVTKEQLKSATPKI